MKLNFYTLIRFAVWMTLGESKPTDFSLNLWMLLSGFIMYFYYGIKNSVLEVGSDGDQNNIELTVTDHEKPDKFASKPQDIENKNIFE